MNNIETEVEFTFLSKSDGNGITQFLAWQTGTASPGNPRNMGVSWTPDRSGEYYVRTFSISNLTNPQVLDTVETAAFLVLETSEKFRIYKLSIGGSEFEIPYSIPLGSIGKIVTDRDSGLILVTFGSIMADTELTITLSDDLMDAVFSNWVHTLPSGEKADYVPEFELDTLFVNPISISETPESTTWVIPIEEGSEEMGIFIGGPI
jgi:hypothetical protein